MEAIAKVGSYLFPLITPRNGAAWMQAGLALSLAGMVLLLVVVWLRMKKARERRLQSLPLATVDTEEEAKP